MSYLVICSVALFVSGLTLFSGFGLGTLLMPAFALFFPVEVAVAATAAVHLANNIFKVALVGRKADFKIVFKFALPAAIAAMVGALMLNYIAAVDPIASYSLWGRSCMITTVKLVIAGLILLFAISEFVPQLEKLSFDPKNIPVGGALSGFFGGLSGHQGALRTAFLIRAGLQKEVFVGSMVVSAVVVDISRLIVYGSTFFGRDFMILRAGGGIGLVLAGSLAAFLGAFIGSRLLKKITMRAIQTMVGVMLFLLAIALGIGLV
ncbi:MAG: sulfite exporter TauE/SafE family protein [Desulfobacterales bacterium]|nr:MAG: sulfite exporter TauE/SafE family protein [Desulfobacterales bacterium]